MKKFLLIAGGAVIMSAASVWGYSYHQEQTMDPWLKANIAALSQNENITSGENPEIGPWGTNWKEVTFTCTKTVHTGGGDNNCRNWNQLGRNLNDHNL